MIAVHRGAALDMSPTDYNAITTWFVGLICYDYRGDDRSCEHCHEECHVAAASCGLEGGGEEVVVACFECETSEDKREQDKC